MTTLRQRYPTSRPKSNRNPTLLQRRVPAELIHYDRLLQNATGFLLQNAPVLLQNATIITNCDDFITKCDVFLQTTQHISRSSILVLFLSR